MPCARCCSSRPPRGRASRTLAEVIDVEHIAEHLYTSGSARPGPRDPHVGGAAARRVPALAERAQRVLLLRGLLARLPQGRLPARPARLRRAAPSFRLLSPAGIPKRHLATPESHPSRHGYADAEFTSWTRPAASVGALGEAVVASRDTAAPHPSGATMASSTRPAPSARQGDEPRRTYVLDTSVLLSDPRAIARFKEHEVVLPVVVITELEAKRHHPELGYFARTPCGCSTTCGSSTVGSTLPCRSARTAAPARRAQPHRCRVAARGLPARRQRHPHPRGGQATWPTRGGWSRSSARTCRCGSRPRRRPGGGGVPRRARGRVGVDRHGRARRHRRGDGPPLRVRPARERRRGGAPLPHRAHRALAPRVGARAGGRRTSRCAGARRPRRLRPARSQRRAAHRPRPAARPRHRHRQPRWPRRHRQVRPRPVRRARGRHGAAPAPQGRRLPAAVRRGRPGARLPARATPPRR
jgi:hypothetical protein